MIPDTDMQRLKSLARATRGGTLDPLPLAQRAYLMGSEACHNTLPPTPAETLNLAELEKIAYQRAFEVSGSLKAAAKLLGIGKTTAYRKARAYGLPAKLLCPTCGRRLIAPLPQSLALVH